MEKDGKIEFWKEKKEKQIVKNTKKTALTVVWLLVLSGFGWSFYNYVLVKKDVKTVSNVDLTLDTARKQKEELLSKVGSLMLIPKNEDPMVANITEIEKLKKEQVFYRDAINGDTVILFPKAKKAIIYRASINKIINIGPILIENKPKKEEPKDLEKEIYMEISTSTMRTASTTSSTIDTSE